MKQNYYHIERENDYKYIFPRFIIEKDTNYIFFLKGMVGAGKSTFIRLFIKYMQDNINVTSPTFPIINEYKLVNYTVFHYDLYRIKSQKELLEIGIDDYLNQNALHFFEWPDKFLNFLPRPDFDIDIDVIDESRIIKIIENDESE